MTGEELDDGPLNDSEQARLDGLLAAARGFNYLNYLVAGVALILAGISDLDDINVPVADLLLPRAPAAVVLYTLSIVLAIVGNRMFKLAYPWLARDARRIAFAWYPLGFRETSPTIVSLWQLGPVVVTAIAVTIVLKSAEGASLLMPGFLLASMPSVVERYAYLISRREDHRGGPATLSIWLLYWYRIVRQILTCLFLVLLVLAAVPSTRSQMMLSALLTGAVLVLLFALRGIATYTFRWIDRIGDRYGFPSTNRHDYS